MKIEQLYTKCLAQGAYYIESNGEVAIIDPLRETGPYLEMAEENGAKIKYIFETHFHADFVSGHVDLAKKTGADVVFGPTASTSYEAIIAEDGQEFKIGDLTIKVLHTPGHTLESSCFLLKDENGKDQAIFTGDTLFIGDVGRPDLAIKSDLTEKDLAGMLFDSLNDKIKPLADDITVYPAHGAGSACGKNMSSETFDLLGNQKKTNYALLASDRDAFIEELTTGILPPPQYFPKNAMLNKTGYASIDEVMKSAQNGLTLDQFNAQVDAGALVLDTRHQSQFVEGFIPGSISIPLGGTYAVWLGSLIEDLNAPIVMIAEQGKEEEAVMRSARVGYDNVIGFLTGGFETWTNAGNPVDKIESITPQEFESRFNSNKLNVLDVRKPGEFSAEHVQDAETFPLDFINGHIDRLNKETEWHVHCQGGYRSVIACSIMKKNGYDNVVDVKEGFRGIQKTSIPTTDYVCPTTIKN